MKNKIFYLFLFVIYLTSCTCKRINTLQDVDDTIEIGNNLAKEIERYKNKYGDYPENLEDLVPEFYDKIPTTRMKEFKEIRAGKYYGVFFRKFKYGTYYNKNNKKLFNLRFYAGLNGNKCNSYARDTCSYWLDFNMCNYYKNKKENGCYKNWSYRKYWDYRKKYNCKENNDFYCIFKKELKNKYIKVQVEE